MYFDGAFSIKGAGAGVLLVSPTGDHLKYVIQLVFSREDATNNTAEYKGLLAGLRIALGLGISCLVIRGDSKLVVNQVNKAYNCPQIWAYLDEVRKLERHFDGLKLEHIPRGKNVIADELSRIAVDKGITIKARYLSTPGARELGRSIDVIEIQDHIVYVQCNLY
jgi:ribonuclease HI